MDEEAVIAAAQTLLDCWPWLTEQYRLGNATEIVQPLGNAIRRYLEHEGL